MNKLQVIILIASGILAVIAVLVFSGTIPGFRPSGPVAFAIEMWGTEPKEIFEPLIKTYSQEIARGSKITYVEKDPRTYEVELVGALAALKGPDAWIIDQALIQAHEDKIDQMPAILFTPREFEERFLDLASRLYIKEDIGSRQKIIIGIPLWSDPMVLFWNKDLFNAAVISNPPLVWGDVLEDAKLLTKKTQSGELKTSGIAFGRARNIPVFKDILSLLLLQQGADIANKNGEIIFGEERREGNIKLNPTESVVRFYTDFANPKRDSYTWNASLDLPHELFSRGDVAIMIDYSSTVDAIRSKNPHLNFDVSKVPQIEGSQIPITVAKIPAFVVSKASSNKLASWRFILWLSQEAEAEKMIEDINVAPVNRNLLNRTSQKPFWEVLRSSSLQARWIHDPRPVETRLILSDMVESIADTRKTVSESIQDARKKLQELIRQKRTQEFESGSSVLLAEAGPVLGGIVPLGCQKGVPCTLCDLYILANRFVNFLLFNLAVPIAIIMFLIGGIILLTAGESEEKQRRGKSILTSVVFGIALAFFAWVIINTLLLTIGFRIPFPEGAKFWQEFPDCPTASFGGGGGPGEDGGGPGPGEEGGGSGPTLTDKEARAKLKAAGIGFNADCPKTCLDGVSQETVDKAIALKKKCSCTVVVSGGTEGGHSGSGPGTHAGGDKLDFSTISSLTAYIEGNFDPFVQCHGVRCFRDPANGAIYAEEVGPSHWDVCFQNCS